MLKFWSVINCIFVDWTKKLTLAQFHEIFSLISLHLLYHSNMFVRENITQTFYRQIISKFLGSFSNYFQQIAAKYNCHQALWLFGPDQEITEVGSMNIFALFKKENGKLELVTPPLDSGLILPGMSIQVVKFSRGGYKIRKIFA